MFALLRTLVRILFFGHSAKNRMASPHKMICSKYLWAFQRWTNFLCRNSDVVKIGKRSYLVKLRSADTLPFELRVQNPFRMCEANTDPNWEYSDEPKVGLFLACWFDVSVRLRRADVAHLRIALGSQSCARGNSQLTGFCVRGNSGRVESNLFQQQTISFDNKKRISFVKKPRSQIFLWPFL